MFNCLFVIVEAKLQLKYSEFLMQEEVSKSMVVLTVELLNC